MASMIKYGIDLGTSNSLIACVDKGLVEVFKDPSGFKETLPSVVGFRNDRILVGDAARMYLQRDSKKRRKPFQTQDGNFGDVSDQISERLKVTGRAFFLGAEGTQELRPW